jgi:YidC/Oxa1 family membrane protein insertase
MNQTRVFLLIAWLLVATLLWMEWNKEKTAAIQPPPVATQTTAGDGAVPGSVPNAPTASAAGVPAAPVQAGVPSSSTTQTAQANNAVVVTTDTLRITLDGGSVRDAELLKFPNEAKSNDTGNVALFDPTPAGFYEAQSGWVSSTGAAPDHLANFVPEGGARNVTLAAGQNAVEVPFIWKGANGVTIRRTYSFPRGGYAIGVRDEVVNQGTANWQGYVYRQLVRNPPPQKTGYTNPEAFAFHGAAWYTPTDKYERRKYADFVDDGTLDKDATGGWIALLQHYFFAAWIPGEQDKSKFTLSTTQDGGVTRYVARAFGPRVDVAPGKTAETNARLWVGPKLVSAIEAQNVPGLTRAVDFSRFSIMATIAGWLFVVLSAIHSVVGNWGWSIIGLVLLIRILLYPIAAQAIPVDGEDAQAAAAHAAAEGTLRRRPPEAADGDDGVVQEGEGQSGRGLFAAVDPDADLPRALLDAVRVGRTAPRAVGAVDRQPLRARSVLHPADHQRRDHVGHAAPDADGRNGSHAAEDDAAHAARDRRDDDLLPCRPGAVLGDQRRARPAPAVVDAQALRRDGAREGVTATDTDTIVAIATAPGAGWRRDGAVVGSAQPVDCGSVEWLRARAAPRALRAHPRER